MKYPHIISKVYGQPWAIHPPKLEAIDRLLKSRLAATYRAEEPAEVTVTIGDEEEEEEDPYANLAMIKLHGIIGKHLDWMEMACGGCSIDEFCNSLNEAAVDSAVEEIWIH